MRHTPPARGAEVVLRQEWPMHEFAPNALDEQAQRRTVRKHIRATVVFVLKRGAFDVVTEGGGKHRVRASGQVDYVRGDAWALRWRGEWLHPDQLPKMLAAEARRT